MLSDDNLESIKASLRQVAKEDPSTGRTFYYDHVRNKTAWSLEELVGREGFVELLDAGSDEALVEVMMKSEGYKAVGEEAKQKGRAAMVRDRAITAQRWQDAGAGEPAPAAASASGVSCADQVARLLQDGEELALVALEQGKAMAELAEAAGRQTRDSYSQTAAEIAVLWRSKGEVLARHVQDGTSQSAILLAQ